MKNGSDLASKGISAGGPPTDSALAAATDTSDDHLWQYELVPSKLGKFKKTELEIINFGPACT